MLRSSHDLNKYAIHASDGIIGHVNDIYFDDQRWVARYIVVLTGSWLSNRKVLISPMAIQHPDWNNKMLAVNLTLEQVRNSPDIDTEKPVSRQHEIGYLGYYNYPYYWGAAGYWGGGYYPGLMLGGANFAQADEVLLKNQAKNRELGLGDQSDHHLRSCKAVTKYHIEVSDGDIGHVSEFLIDEETWAIRYLIVDTSNWWMGHRVLISPRWIKNVSWPESTITVDLTRQAVKDAPRYDGPKDMTYEHETAIYRHYARSGYWKDENKMESALRDDL